MTNNTMTNIEKNVMRRVHTAHALRPFVSGGTLAVVVGVLALWGIGREVWVARVFENMPHTGDLMAVVRFYVAAFLNTRVPVQALSLAVLGAFVYLARETARLLMRPFAGAAA